MEYLGPLGFITLTTIISNISTSSSNLTKLIGLVNTRKEDEDVEIILHELDIQSILKSIEMFINDVKIDESSPKSLIHCMEQILESINKIEEEINKIKYRIEFNKNKWFYQPPYRFMNCINRLRTNINQLESRKRMLFSTISIRSALLKNELTTIPSESDIEIKKGLKLFNKK